MFNPGSLDIHACMKISASHPASLHVLAEQNTVNRAPIIGDVRWRHNLHSSFPDQICTVLSCCCLPTPMTLASGGSSPASFSVHLTSSRRDVCHACECYRGGIVVMDVF